MFIGALASAMYDIMFSLRCWTLELTFPRLYGLTTLQVWRVPLSPFPDVVDSDLQTYLYYVYYPSDSLESKFLVSHSEYIHLVSAPYGTLVYIGSHDLVIDLFASVHLGTYLQGTWHPTWGAEYVLSISAKSVFWRLLWSVSLAVYHYLVNCSFELPQITYSLAIGDQLW